MLCLLGGGASAGAEEAVLAKVDANATPAAAPPVDFGRQIRPILSDKCFACHGPDEQTRAAGLRLDMKDSVLTPAKSGRTPVIPGDPDNSELIRRVLSHDDNVRMPPARETRQPTAQELELLQQWVLQGAPWEEHWAFVAPESPALPSVSKPDWPHQGLDLFVLAGLERQGLAPSAPADKRTLIRRVSFDLTGLPPTREEVEAFVADTSPQAYERLVDRLLASPQYGEHMTRYWLDLARYADTNGYHIDNERFMWRWRDWVIKAFNENLPFDEFTVQQLAGDLLPNATLDQKIASGFNRNHMITFEGGIIEEEYRAQYVMDRVNTLGTVWMGLTVSCAQCHDHKYDPISQKEYYQLYAFFNSVPEKGSDGNRGNSAPMMRAPLENQEEQLAALETRVAALREQLQAPMPEADVAQAKWEAEARTQLEGRWTVLTPDAATAQGGTQLDILEDGALLAHGENPDQQVYEISVKTDLQSITAIRLEALVDASLPHQGHGRSDNGNVVLSGFEVDAVPVDNPELVKQITFASVNADHSQPKFDPVFAIDGKADTGWATDGHARRENRALVFVPTERMGFATGTELRFRVKHESTQFAQHALGKFRLSVSTDPGMSPSLLGPWYMNGPYLATYGNVAYETEYGPEQGVDLHETYDDGRAKWVRVLDNALPDGVVNNLSGDVAATYLYREIVAPTARILNLGLGSNDALKVWVNGKVVLDNDVQRGVAPDQDLITVDLEEGKNALLMKVVNYGNAYAFYFNNKNEQTGDIPLDIESLLALETRQDGEEQRLREFYRARFVPAWKELRDQVAAAEAEQKAFEATIPEVMVMAEMETPRDTFLLIRGAYDQPGDQVFAMTPSVLPPLPADAVPTRLSLARWLVDGRNPLTARVTVNRFWHHLFGTGLVKTVEDFGVQGERPMHPELLDWLALEFVRMGWDTKAFLKMIVTSATYQQSSRLTPELLERDPENRLLARGSRFRLDAEAIRDNALAVSGLLVPTIGGPSVNPYQPGDLWKEVSYGGTEFSAQEFVQDSGDKLYRRSMYTFWKRQAPPASMLILDAPTREVCTSRRPRTNTPLQALQQMNDAQFVEAARHLAQRMLTEGGEEMMARLAYGFELATARIPSDDEKAILCEVLAAQLEDYRAKPEQAEALLAVGESAREASLDPVEHAAWTTIASMILNLDETISKS